MGSTGASLKVPEPPPQGGGARAGVAGYGGGGGFGRVGGTLGRLAPTAREDSGLLEALEGGGWAHRGRDGVLTIVDPARGVVAVTREDGRPTPDGRWLMPAGVRLDRAPMTGARRLRRGDRDWVWGEHHAVSLVDADRRKEPPPDAIGRSPDGKWVPRSFGPTPGGWFRAATEAGMSLQGTDGQTGPRLVGCLSESSVRWSPDGSRLTCRTERGVAALDVRGRRLGEWVTAERGFDPEDAFWSPLLDLVVLVGGGEVVAWPLADGPSWRTRVTGPGADLDAVVTDDGSLVIVTDGVATAVLGAVDGARLDDVGNNPSGSAERVARLPDGALVAVSRSTLSWWDADGSRLGQVHDPGGPLVLGGLPCWVDDCTQSWQVVGADLVSADGRQVPLDLGRWVRIEHRSPSGRWWLVQAARGAAVVDLDGPTVVSVEGKWDTVDDGGGVWRATSGGIVGQGAERIDVDQPVSAFEVYADEVVVGIGGGGLRRIPRTTPELPMALAEPVPPRPTTLERALPSGSFRWLEDGRILIGGRAPVIVDPNALVGGTWTVEAAAPAAASRGPEVLWTGASWALVDGDGRTPIAGLPHGQGAAVSADGQRVVVIEANAVWTWSRAAGVEGRFAVDGPSALALSPDGAKLALLTPLGVELVELATRRALHVGPPSRDAQMQFSPDGRWLAIGPELVLVDVETGTIRFDAVSDTFHGVSALAIAPDGDHLAVLDRRGRLGLWQLATGGRLWLSNRLGTPSGVRFLADGTIEARFDQGRARFDLAGQPIEAAIVPEAMAIAVDDQGGVRVFDSRTGWASWATGLPMPLSVPIRDPAWNEVTQGVRASWSIPGFSGSVPPAEPPCASDGASAVCSTVPANSSPVVTAGLEWVSPSPGGAWVIGKRSEGGDWVLRGPNGAETSLRLPPVAGVAWTASGTAVAAASGGVWQIRVDGEVSRVAAVREDVKGMVAAGGRMVRWMDGAVLAGPAATDEVTCVLPGSAGRAAISPNGRFVAWTHPGALKVADLEECRITLAAEVPARGTGAEVALEPRRGSSREPPTLREVGPRGDLQRQWDTSELPAVSAAARGGGDTVAIATVDGRIRILDLVSLPELPVEPNRFGARPDPSRGDARQAEEVVGLRQRKPDGSPSGP